MNLEQLKAFLASDEGKTEEVKTIVKSQFPLSQNDVNVLLETKDGSAMLDSIKDKHLQKGLETWKTNNLETLIDSEIKKRFPAKDEREIEVEKLKSEVEKMRTERHQEQLKTKALKLAGDKGLPIEMVDFFVGVDDSVTEQNLNLLSDCLTSHVARQVDARLKTDSYVPFNGQSAAKNLENMSMDEYIKARKKGV